MERSSYTFRRFLPLIAGIIIGAVLVGGFSLARNRAAWVHNQFANAPAVAGQQGEFRGPPWMQQRSGEGRGFGAQSQGQNQGQSQFAERPGRGPAGEWHGPRGGRGFLPFLFFGFLRGVVIFFALAFVIIGLAVLRRRAVERSQQTPPQP